MELLVFTFGFALVVLRALGIGGKTVEFKERVVNNK